MGAQPGVVAVVLLLVQAGDWHVLSSCLGSLTLLEMGFSHFDFFLVVTLCRMIAAIFTWVHFRIMIFVDVQVGGFIFGSCL